MEGAASIERWSQRRDEMRKKTKEYVGMEVKLAAKEGVKTRGGRS
jgi:hypothetical protein